jgi:hypothetical protein
MTQESRIIFDWIGELPIVDYDWDKRLPKLYEGLNEKWFNNRLPAVSGSFVVAFCEMPNESAGICIDAHRAREKSTEAVKVRPGIRINSNLKCLNDHVQIALLHEMVHADGIIGHNSDFQDAIKRLKADGAYCGLL